MPTKNQYEIVKQQLKSFEKFGTVSEFEIQTRENGYRPKIVLYNFKTEKLYHFSDPDWDIVSRQLATLYCSIKIKEAIETHPRKKAH